MPRHLLSDRQVRTARPKAKPYRLADGDGLYLFVPSSGVRSWQLRYSLHGKQQTATLGKLTEMSLAEARAAAHEARKGVAKGTHLTVAKRVEMAKRRVATDNTFKAVAADWVSSEAQRAKWTPAYRREVEASLKNHLRDLNALPLVEVTAPVVAPVMRVVEHSAPYMVEKVRRRLRVILDYGVEQGVIVGNPLPSTRRGPKIERRHFPAVTDLEGVGAILRAHDAADACKGVRRAHQLLVFTALRPGEVVPARWEEFNLEQGTWSVPRKRMKIKDKDRGDHDVPLPPALVAMLKEWRRMDTKTSTFVCPAPRDPLRHITPEAIEKHYREVLSLAGKHSPHSWRSTLSTIARNAGKHVDSIERQLDHGEWDKSAEPYNRARLLELRRELMNWYADTITAARDRIRNRPA